MANTVEIVITVDNSQGLTALNSTMTSLKQLGVEGDVSMRAVAGASDKAAGGLNNVGNAARTMGGHMTTSLDGVRLLSQEFGIRLPRALESILARMPAVTAAVGSFINVFAGIAVAEVLFRIGEGAYNLYEKYISLTAAAKQYNDEVQKHQDEKFVDTHSIEVTIQRIDEATAAAKRFHEAAQQGSSLGWENVRNGAFGGNPLQLAAGVKGLLDARGNEESGFKKDSQKNTLQEKSPEQQEQLNNLAIEAKYYNDQYEGLKRINSEKEKAHAMDASGAQYRRIQDGLPKADHPSDELSRAQDLVADRKAAGEEANLARETSKQVIALRNEATNAGLQNNALLRAQEEQAIAAIAERVRASEITKQQARSETDAIALKFHNEEMKRLTDETEAVQKRADIERDASLTGLAKVQAEGQRKIGDVDDRERKGLYSDQSGPGAPSALATKDRATATAEMYRNMADAEKSYQQTVASEDERSSSQQLSGFAKIDAEVAASTLKRADDFEKMYGQMDHAGATYLSAQQALAQSEATIAAAGDRERAQLEQSIRDQTLHDAAEAAQAERKVRAGGIGGWVADYRSGIAEVEAAEAASIAKINAEQSKPGTTGTAYDLYQQQKVAAEQKADAQIEELNQQMAHTVASTLEGAFNDPVHYIQNKMKQMMFEVLADWITQSTAFKSTFGALMGGLHLPGTATGGGIAAPVGATGAAAGASPRVMGIPMPGVTSSGVGITGAAVSSPQRSGTGAVPTITDAGGGFGSEADYSGTVNQASIAPSYSGTVSHAMVAPSYSGTLTGGGSGGAGGMLSGSMALAGQIGAMGLGIAGGNSTPDTVTSSAASSGSSGAVPSFDDATIGSEQDASSVGATGGPIAQPQSSNGSSAASGGNTLGGIAGAAFGAYTGTKGVIGAFESGKASGILSGAESGATLGASVGMLAGPLGAAIGGAAGAIGGATAGLVGWASGEGNRLQAQKYYRDTMKPQMEAVETAYGRGQGGDIDSALSQINSIANSGIVAMAQKSGMSAAMWAKSAYVDKEISYLSQMMERMASGGADYTRMSAAQFHTGGTISDFGDLGTSSNEGFIHAMLNEKIANVGASTNPVHGPAIDMMNQGASASDVASHYLRSTGAGSSQAAQSGGDTHHHWNVQTMDADSFHSFLRNKGGMAAINKAANKYTNQYAGDASHG